MLCAGGGEGAVPRDQQRARHDGGGAVGVDHPRWSPARQSARRACRGMNLCASVILELLSVQEFCQLTGISSRAMPDGVLRTNLRDTEVEPAMSVCKNRSLPPITAFVRSPDKGLRRNGIWRLRNHVKEAADSSLPCCRASCCRMRRCSWRVVCGLRTQIDRL